jgi:uncharacterized protein YfiM (DUF2279 family)
VRRAAVLLVPALLAGVPLSPVAAQPPAGDSALVSARKPEPPEHAGGDRWLGVDKVQHFFVAGFVYAASFSVARLAGAERQPALAIAVAPTALVSVGKEVHDRRTGGRFSVKDLVADALGAAAYGALLAHTVH